MVIDNIIKYLIVKEEFKIIQGISDLSFSYSGVSQTILVKDNITIVIGLAGDSHLALCIKKNDNMAFYQDAMQINNETISKVIEIIKRDDYFILEKSVTNIKYNSDSTISYTFIGKEYEYPQLKHLF